MKFIEYEDTTKVREVGALVGACLREMGLAKGLNEHKAAQAWDEISGAARHTLSRGFSSGTLYIRLDSSMVRNVLYPRLGAIQTRINEALTSDPLFTRAASNTEPVRKIVLR